MPTRTLSLGLTGGIGCGKSAAAALLREDGVPVFDADACVHGLLANDPEVKAALLAFFGVDIFTPTGTLDKAALAARVFAHAQERAFLEGLLHPRVRRACREARAAAQGQGAALFVAEVPLLFENGFDKEFDANVCVWAAEDIRWARLRARGLSAGQIAARAAAQWPLDKKAAAAGLVLLNDGNLEFLKDQLQVLRTRLLSA